MPVDYNGLNFGSYTLAELTGVLLSTVTDAYFWSLDPEDLYVPVEPLELIEDIMSPVPVLSATYSTVGVIQSIYTPEEVVNATYQSA